MKKLNPLPEPYNYAGMQEFAEALNEHNDYLADIAENHRHEYNLEEVLQQAIKIKLAMKLLLQSLETELGTKEDNTDKQETPPSRPDDATIH